MLQICAQGDCRRLPLLKLKGWKRASQNGGRWDHLPGVRWLNICGGDHQLWNMSSLVRNLFSGRYSPSSICSLKVSFQLCWCDTHWWLRGQRGCPLLLSKVFKHKWSHANWNSAMARTLQYFVFSSSCNEQERRAKKAKKQQQQLQQQTSQAAGSAPAGKSPRQLSSSSQPLQNQVFGHYEKSVALKYSLSDHWKQIEDE